jgi:Glycosyl hydrolase family 20, catalytic domain
LNHDFLKVEKTQDWRLHHAVFNSQDRMEATLYLGCWDGKTGELWWDDAALGDPAFVNLVRRPGAPLVVRTADGRELTEGKDFEELTDPLMGTKPYAGCYTVWHEPPVLKTKLPDGTRLLASWHHAVTVHDDQACICPSEPKTVEVLRDHVERVHKLWEPAGFMMSHDEIRIWNHCAACRARNFSAGQLLADNVRTCIKIIRDVNPAASIYVWSDMFDPNHNAKNDYYLARGDFKGSWDGLDKNVTVVAWHFEKRAESLKFFADRGHRQVIAGYYDSNPANVRKWLEAAAPYAGVEAVMYTTWQNNYQDMEAFFGLAGATVK